MEEEVTGSRGGQGGGRKAAAVAAGEVELKEKAGTAWSHSYLNQKPWHPLSYPNQRRKWIADEIHANRARRQEEVQREFAQEKMEIMKALSFMYVRPPGYNVESAKAADIEDEKKRSDQGDATQPSAAGTSSMPDKVLDKTHLGPDKKNRPKDVFGPPLPTEQEFEFLKNAPRLDTGAPVRIKPFGVEVRNVRCLRCGNYGHQSGDQECPLKEVIMPNEESLLKRDDPLTAIVAQTDSSEPLKWELKQKPGMSPPRGGYNPDDPNQQIVAEDIFDEYGGFLGGSDIPALLTNLSASKWKKHSKGKKAGISSLSLLLMQNPEGSTAVMIHPRTPNLRRAIEHQKARERKVISLSHHILMLMWKLETASRSRSANIRKNMCQSPLLIQKLKLMKIQGGIQRKSIGRRNVRKKLLRLPSLKTKNIRKTRGVQGDRGRGAITVTQSSSESERHSTRRKDRQYYGDASFSESNRH